MRLYALSCGRLRCRKNIFVPDADKNEVIEAPMPVFLITHPQGNVLFDTGPHPSVFKDASSRWGGLAKAFEPVGDEGSWVVAKLQSTGISPSDIRHVVNSHLHFDHAGANQYFPESTFLVSRKEMACARNPEHRGKGYIPADWDHPLDYREMEGEMDIYGDGTLVILPSPGHTLGHQSLLVRLREDQAFILSGDSAPCMENFRDFTLSRNNMDDEQAMVSIRNLHEVIEVEKALLIHGHDPQQWEEIRKAPEFYS